jgi:PhoH-like ATPase
MRKTLVFDTSALIYDPCAWKQFPHHDLIIPMAVLEELDKLKKQSDQAGRNARVCVRFLDEIKDKGQISTGILLDNDVLLKVDATFIDISDGRYGDPTYGDSKILACLVATSQNDRSRDVTLISNDLNLRVKSEAFGIPAISHQGQSQLINELYSGVRVVDNEELGLDLASNGVIDPRVLGIPLHPHECVLFQGDNEDGIALGRKVGADKLRLVKKHYPWNIRSRNKEQAFAIDLIMDPNLDLITLIGRAGTGKSLMALASALELVVSKREYDKLIIYRPIQTVGKDIGYLPGSISEKLAPWFQAIMDNFELLFSNKVGSDWKKDLEMFQKKGRIEMEAITYIRGRSIPNCIILVDECQNLSREEVKTILTRGEGTKVVLTGDLEQIDNSDLDATSNGLTYTIEKFKDSEFAGHITLTQGERSRLASTAAEIL